MDGMSSVAVLMTLAVAMGGFLWLARGLGSKQDPREPPFVAASIPYIGHIIGLMRSKFNYYVQLRYTQFRLRRGAVANCICSQQNPFPRYI